MGEVVNLRAWRKAKARAEKEETASTNRALHGRTRAEKLRETIEKTLDERRLDGHKRGDDPPDGPSGGRAG